MNSNHFLCYIDAMALPSVLFHFLDKNYNFVFTEVLKTIFFPERQNYVSSNEIVKYVHKLFENAGISNKLY